MTARVMAQWKPSACPHEVERPTETWRRWQHAADQLGDANEVEDFQAVGMRLREVTGNLPVALPYRASPDDLRFYTDLLGQFLAQKCGLHDPRITLVAEPADAHRHWNQ